MTNVKENPAQRTYGGFTAVGRKGFFGLSLWAFFGVLLAILPILVLWVVAGVRWGLIASAILALLVIPLVVPKRDGRSLYSRWFGRLADVVGDKAGNRDLVNGPAGNAPDGSFRIPGLGADSRISSQVDVYGHQYALITYPRVHHHVVVFECYPTGNTLVDQGSIDKAVAHWGAWLAHLGTEMRIVAASVTVETATDTGLRLRRAVTSRLSQIAPRFARAVVGSILETFNAAAPAINTKIAVTLSGHAQARDEEVVGQDEIVAELSTIVPTLRDGLRLTGAGSTVRSCTEGDLVDYVRVAYDPASGPDIEQLRGMGQGTGLRWEEAGPAVARAVRDYYAHDGVVSTSWTMAEGPRSIIYDSALSNLLRPEARVLRKRVTVLYRPEPAERTAAIVDQMENNASFASSLASQRARNDLARAAAHQMSMEESQGAGLVRQGLVVTCTVPSVDDLRMARQVVTTQAASTR
ncbi:SCO6880 family protein, partial [Brachybacterium alimentarium]